MNYSGVVIGISSFFIIGIFHPIVIKSEYYIGKKAWPAFLMVGIVLILFSLLIDNTLASAIVGVAGFSALWSIHELFQQEERVNKGWFPQNPHKSQKL